jgi:lysophospholipase L1-like esterase
MKHLLFIALLTTSCTTASSKELLVVGDSIAAKASLRGNSAGWGQYLQEYLPAYHVVNGAIGGKSSKSYWDKYWEGAYAITKPHVVVLMFVHNDMKPEAFRHTDPQTTFKDYLRNYNAAVKADKARLILVTPTERTEHTGCISDRLLEPYVQAMKEVGESDGVQVIDIWTGSVERLEADCFTDSMVFYADKAHLSKAGAKYFAWLIAKEFLKEQK